jgi:hypothetical protein
MGFAAGHDAYAQQHFQPVANTGMTSAIIIQDVQFNGLALQPGDEIGVFDGMLCVGVVVFDGNYPVSCPGIMEFATPGGEVLPGAKEGNAMLFKVWQQSSDLEGDATATFANGGDFGDVLTVVDQLAAQATCVECDDPSASPDAFLVSHNYPNPFNPSTTIHYQLPAGGRTRIHVYDIHGDLVQTLLDADQAAGVYTVRWDGRNEGGMRVASGTYLLRIETGVRVETRKLLLTK